MEYIDWFRCTRWHPLHDWRWFRCICIVKRKGNVCRYRENRGCFDLRHCRADSQGLWYLRKEKPREGLQCKGAQRLLPERKKFEINQIKVRGNRFCFFLFFVTCINLCFRKRSFAYRIRLTIWKIRVKGWWKISEKRGWTWLVNGRKSLATSSMLSFCYSEGKVAWLVYPSG